MENNTDVNQGINHGNICLSGNEISKLLQENIILRFENKKLQDEIGILAEEIKKFKDNTQKYPCPVATVTDVLEDGRAIVTINFGSEIVVTYTSDKKLRVDDKVVLRNDFGAITEILPKSHQISLMNMDEKPNITYADIGGLHEQKRAIKEVVELPLKNPEIFRKVGISPPKGVLLYGPPGTGKTLLAKAVANATNAKFIEVVASELAQKYLGEGSKLVREIFRYAKENAPAIIFIDEIDGIAHSRSGDVQGADREVQRTLAQLLAEMDGFKPLDKVKVIAATNRVDIIDNALLRPGRFDRLIEIPLCDYEGRKEIFEIYLNKMNIRDINIDELSRVENLSGAQIKGICMEAGLNAIRQNRDYVVQDDFANAIEKTEKNKMTNKFGIPVVQELYV